MRSKRIFSLETLPGYSPLDTRPAPTSAPTAKPPPASPAAQQPPRHKAAAQQPHRDADDASWVQTADDAIEFFARHGSSAPAQFFYCLSDGGGEQGAREREGGTADFFLRVVPPAQVANAQRYLILSRRQLVRVDRRAGEHTETLPLEQWAAHKRAFLRLRQLNCLGPLAKAFHRWRRASRGQVLRRRRHQLEEALLFPGAQLEVGGLLAQLRAARATGVQPGRCYSGTAEWAEQQGSWRAHRAQPQLEAAAAALVRVAEGVCAQVEAAASLMLESVRPSELLDRIGVDLGAATSKARARSMQQIKAEKVARAQAYHRALAERASLPRFLRLLDLRLRSALADMAAASMAEAASALRAATAAAPGLQLGGDAAHGGGAADSRAGSEDREAAEAGGEGEGEADGGGAAGGRASQRSGQSSSPPFSVSLVLGGSNGGGDISFCPSEAEWAAALEAECVESSLHLASTIQPLLSLPAFERYQLEAQLLAGASEGQAEQQQGEQQQQQQQHGERRGAVELAQADAVFCGAGDEVRTLLRQSFAEARQVAQRYQRYQAIQRFGQDFDFEAWATQQRAGLDLSGTEATLRQLQAWQEELESMPLAATAGLLHVDAAQLQAGLAPVVASARHRISGLLLELASDSCRGMLHELTVWLEVAAARPPELGGFLPWAAGLADMRQGSAGQLGAVAAADAALELVVAFAGRLPTAEAVKRDDLRQAAGKLEAELAAAASWAAEQRAVHAGAMAEQARQLAEEAVLLESELKSGVFADAGGACGEVLGELELAQSRLAQLAAQAEAAGQVQRELGGEAASLWEIGDAGTALQRCTEVWGLVQEAEELLASLAPPGTAALETEAEAEQAGQLDSGPDESGEAHRPAEVPLGQVGGQVAALRERLASLRGAGAAPDAVWLRASSALLSCQDLVAALPAANPGAGGAEQ